MLVDRVHHGGAQDVSLESWVHESHHQSAAAVAKKMAVAVIVYGRVS